MRSEGALISRPATTAMDAALIFTHLLPMHAEVGRAPLDHKKMLANVAHSVMRHAAYVVEDVSGDEPRIIASMGLIELDYWYSQDSYLSEVWFYVHPDYRDGEAARLLLAEARQLSERTGLSVMLVAFSEKRQRPRNGLERIATQVSFAPAGAIFAVQGDAHVG